MDERRYGRVICWKKNNVDSFFIVYSKRTLLFLERFQCNNGLLLRNNFLVELGGCYSVEYARYCGSDCHAIIYELNQSKSIAPTSKNDDGSINMLVECNWNVDGQVYFSDFCEIDNMPPPPEFHEAEKVWCRIMRGSELRLEFVEFDEEDDGHSEHSSGQPSECSGGDGDSGKNIFEGFNLKGNLVTIASGNYSCFSGKEMQDLFRLAQLYCDGRMYPFEVLHRCKPKKYFDRICEYPGAMMWPYMKDGNGHKQSAINTNISGLFFNTATMLNVNNSPYGNVQLVMNASKILDISSMNFYFADFYCNEGQGHGSSSALHYLTIVVCRKKSTIDSFCKEHLINLDPSDNKFLKFSIQPNGKDHQYFTAYKAANNATHRQELMVEIFYTEPVSLYAADKMRKIESFGRGRSLPNGLPNNDSCIICNI